MVMVTLQHHGNSFLIPAGNGFHYIVGDRTDPALLGAIHSSLTFNLLAGTTPTPISGSMGAWQVTGGNMTANFANAQLSGNVGLYNNQPAGYGFFNMGFSGALSSSAPVNNVTTNVVQTSGSLNMCTGGCAGTGNVVFYGNNAAKPAEAAGLSYNFNTGSNVVQGVAVFKR